MDCSPPGSSVHFGGAYMVSWPDLFCKLVLIWLFGGDEGNFRAILYFATAAAKSLQSCPTVCDPIDGSPPGSSVPGILQARTLEWVAISFSNAWKWKVKLKSLSRILLLATPWTAAYQAPPSMGFSRQEYRSGMPLPSPVLEERSNILRVIYETHFSKSSVPNGQQQRAQSEGYFNSLSKK